jgi:hypothetical protein
VIVDNIAPPPSVMMLSEDPEMLHDDALEEKQRV